MKTSERAVNLFSMAITAYYCVLCGTYHQKRHRKFKEHYESNRPHCGWKTEGLDRVMEPAPALGKTCL